MKKAVTRVGSSIRRGAAIALTLAVCLQGSGVKVYASGDDTNAVQVPEVRSINLNINGSIAGIHDPSGPEDENSEWSNGSGSHIRYGNRWFNVLDCDADDFTQDGSKSVFLWSEELIAPMKFSQITDNSTPGKNAWADSQIREYLNNDFLGDSFSSVEQAAIADSYNDSHSGWERLSRYWKAADLDGDKVFLLDAVEATSGKYGFMETASRSKSRAHNGKNWWLRSCVTNNQYEAGYVAFEGMVSSVNASVPVDTFYYGAALNLSLDDIFFSAAQNSRPYYFTETEEKEGGERWLVTIYDGNSGFDARLLSDPVLRDEKTVNIKVDDIGEAFDGVTYNQITGMLVDENGTVIACGKIGNIDDEEIEVELPDGIADGSYTLKVFAEQTFVRDTTTYASHEKDLHFRVSSKKEFPDIVPESAISVANDVKTVSDVALPSGWDWTERASDMILPQGDTVMMIAEYTGEDVGEYENTSISIEVTRASCVEDEDVLFTGDGDTAPSCTEHGSGHTECSLCGDTLRTGVEVEPLGHEWEEDYTVDKEPSCAEEGSRSIHCSVCGEKKDSSPIDKTEHEAEEAVTENMQEASCTEEGAYDEVTYCRHCGEEISRERKVIERKAHTPSEPVSANRVEPSCTDKGNYDEVVYCADCGTELTRTQKILDEADHEPGQMVIENVIEPTCTSEGSYDEAIYCGDCGIGISRVHKTTDIRDHEPGEMVKENETASTCREHGHYGEVVCCKECGEELSRVTVEKGLKAHLAGSPVRENVVEATHDEAGSYDEVVYCLECGGELSRTSETIPKIEDEVSEPSDNGSGALSSSEDSTENQDSGDNGNASQSGTNGNTGEATSSEPPATQQGESNEDSNPPQTNDETDNGSGSDSTPEQSSNNDEQSSGTTDQGDSSSGSPSSPSSSVSTGIPFGGGSGSSGYSGSTGTGGTAIVPSPGDDANTPVDQPDDSSNISQSSDSMASDTASQPDTTELGNDGSLSDSSMGGNEADTVSEEDRKEPVSRGDVIQDSSNGFEYKVSTIGKNAAVLFNGVADKKKSSVQIPAKVKIDGVSYKVTGISAGAFKNNRNLKKITVGKNITNVGKNAFKGCIKLKTITIKSKNIKKIGTGAFVGINKKAVIKVPKKSLGKYKKLLKSAKLSNKVKVKAY